MAMVKYTKSHLKLRPGGYYAWERDVPRQLQDLVGKRAWTKYLGKVTPAQATILGRVEDVRADRIIARLKVLSPDDRATLIAAGGFDKLPQHVAETTKALPYTAAVALHFKEEDVDLNDLDDGDGGPLAALQAIRVAKGLIAATDHKRRLVNKLEASDDTDGSDLAKLIPVFQKFSPPRDERRVRMLKLYVKRFVAAVGDVRLSKIDRAHAIAFRSSLETAGATSDMIQAHLGGIRRLFVIALSQGIVAANPFMGVLANKVANEKFSDRKAKKRRIYSGDEVKRILAGSAKLHPDRAWIIKLMAYCGARSGELVQLRPSDITTAHGISIMRLTDEGEEERNFKNEHSVRDVPIHPECMGIIDYAAAAAGQSLVFHDFTKARNRATAFQREGRPFLDGIGINDRRATMHSLRHTWRSVGRELNMPRDVSRAIMGHSPGEDENDLYGEPPSLTLRYEWIKKVDPTK